VRFATLVETFWQDLRFGVRALVRHPGFTAVAVVTLALGIGANAAIFSVVNAVLLRPLPWGEPDRSVMIWSRWTSFDKTWVADGEVLDYRRRSRTLQEIAAWSDGQVNLTGDGEPERVAAALVTANSFHTLGAQPMLGRIFTEAEDVPNGPNLVVPSASGIDGMRRIDRFSADRCSSTATRSRSSVSCRPGSSCRLTFRIPSPRSFGRRCRSIRRA